MRNTTAAAAVVLVFSACTPLPDVEPVIVAALELRMLGVAELARHRAMAEAATFSGDAERQAALAAEYLAILETHARTQDQLVGAIVSWAQRVGEVSPALSAQTLDQLVDAYLRLKEATK